ncbi:MAG: transposase [Marinisporobacter sp.]|jgi:transposase-like protein|nr:transposase [Marinisporobacter sp.]
MAKNNKRYSIEEKQKLIKRMLPPENCSVTKLSNETGIHKFTLSTWKSKALKGQPTRECGRPKNILSSREKFMIVMETYTLSEIELSKYCREHGLYVENVRNWRISCMDANNGQKSDHVNSINLKTELVEEKMKSKELLKELRPKDKALAETVALLVLRKKLDAIFEED